MSTHPAAPTVRSADGVHATIECMTEEVLKTAQGIGDLGMLTVAAAFFVVLSGAMMLGMFRWFRKIIDNTLRGNSACTADIRSRLDDIADGVGTISEGLRPETRLRIKETVGIHFRYAVERVCRVIKRVREENNIDNRAATARKIRTLLKNIHDERNQALDCYTYKGRKLSDYTSEGWIERVAQVVEGEIYNEAGANNRRAFTNVSMAYGEIENDFMQRLDE